MRMRKAEVRAMFRAVEGEGEPMGASFAVLAVGSVVSAGLLRALARRVWRGRCDLTMTKCIVR
jgi:hypothetical protein